MKKSKVYKDGAQAGKEQCKQDEKRGKKNAARNPLLFRGKMPKGTVKGKTQIFSPQLFRKVYGEGMTHALGKQEKVVRDILMEQRKLANSRIKHIRRAQAKGRDVWSPAYDRMKWFLNNRGGSATLSESKNLTLEQLLEDALEVQSFLVNKTSRVRGAIEFENERMKHWTEKQPDISSHFDDEAELKEFLRFLGEGEVSDFLSNSFDSGEEVEKLADVMTRDDKSKKKLRELVDKFKKSRELSRRYNELKEEERAGIITLNQFQEELNKLYEEN